MHYTKGFNSEPDVNTAPDDSVAHWQKKNTKARILIGVLTVICSILIVIVIITLETKRGSSQNNCPMVKKDEKRASASVIKFFHVSDFHYDPFYDKTITSKNYFCRAQETHGNGTADYAAPYGRIGCDTPKALIDISLEGMKNISHSENVNFIVLTGDLSGHKMWTDYSGPERVLSNIAEVSNKTHVTFPNIPVFPMIGNNDLPGHYVLPNSTSDWYKTVLSYWAPLILCSTCPGEVTRPTTMEALQETFLDGGYYNASIGDGKMVLLVLNSLYWSIDVQPSEESTQKAVKQLTWLEGQLRLARSLGKKAVLASHIPPGIDSFSKKPFWFSNYTKTFVNLVANIYKDVVAGQLFAHIHRGDFRLQISAGPKNEDLANESFVLLAPSISPVYANNPAFRVVSLDTEAQSLEDYSQYYMDLVMATEFSNPVWQLDYTFSEKFPSTNKFLNAARIDELNQQLINQTNSKFWKGYIFSRQTNYQPLPYSRFVLYCAMKNVFDEDFKRCIERLSVPGG